VQRIHPQGYQQGRYHAALQKWMYQHGRPPNCPQACMLQLHTLPAVFNVDKKHATCSGLLQSKAGKTDYFQLKHQ